MLHKRITGHVCWGRPNIAVRSGMVSKLINHFGYEPLLIIDNGNVNFKSYELKRDVSSEIVFIQLKLTTDTTVGDRNVQLRLRDPLNIFDYAIYPAPIVQPEGTTRTYIFSKNTATVSDSFAVNDYAYFPMPAWEVNDVPDNLSGGYKIFMEDGNDVSSNDTIHYTMCLRLWNY